MQNTARILCSPTRNKDTMVEIKDKLAAKYKVIGMAQITSKQFTSSKILHQKTMKFIFFFHIMQTSFERQVPYGRIVWQDPNAFCCASWSNLLSHNGFLSPPEPIHRQHHPPPRQAPHLNPIYPFKRRMCRMDCITLESWWENIPQYKK